MRLLLVRHGEEDTERQPESARPLNDRGRREAERLRERLRQLRIVPSICLTSPWRHASETAAFLPAPGSDVSQLPLECLARGRGDSLRISDVLAGLEAKGVRLNDSDVVVVVGHEPHLSQLLESLTGRRHRPLERLESVVLRADSIATLIGGQANVEIRLPVRDFQEKEVREKVRSKLQVTTLLAGFTLNAIFVVLREGGPAPPPVIGTFGSMEIPAAAVRATAITCLFLAVVLFAAAAYMFDRLATPEGLWTAERHPAFRQAWPASFRRNLLEYGPLYAYMIRTWWLVFSPAVCLTAVGFFALLVLNSAWTLVLTCGVALALGLLIYFLLRPRLGID